MKIFLITLVMLLVAAAHSFAQCPSIKVIGPPDLTLAGGNLVFRVDEPASNLKYFWTVSAGTITEGQGKPSITVRTDITVIDYLNAVVRIEGLPPGCNAVGSERAIVIGNIDHFPRDTWSGLKPNDERLRLDSFFAELSNSTPDQIGIVVLSTTRNERLDSRNRRLRFVLKHANYRKVDKRRIWFVLERRDERRTTLWRIPPGVDPPCPNCLLIKGGDIK